MGEPRQLRDIDRFHAGEDKNKRGRAKITYIVHPSSHVTSKKRIIGIKSLSI